MKPTSTDKQPEAPHPFYAKFSGGPFDGLEIAARSGPVPFVMWLETNGPDEPIDFTKITVTDKTRIHRYERHSTNDGFSWVFLFAGYTLDV